jgi:hypothetical protein
MTKGRAMRRLMLLGLLLVAAAAGCRSVEKSEPVSGADPPYYHLPKIITAENWWRKGELSDLDLEQ